MPVLMLIFLALPPRGQQPLPRLRAATLTALGFSWLGDSVPDLTSGDGAFIAMVACFLCAQVAFIVGLLPHWRASVLGHNRGLVAVHAVGLTHRPRSVPRLERQRAVNRDHGDLRHRPGNARHRDPALPTYSSPVSNPDPTCPECASEHTYELSGVTVCSLCGHEWHHDEASTSEHSSDSPSDDAPVIRDAVGNVLSDGDNVTVIKDLPVKGSPKPIKAGTKVRGIRLVQGVGDHDIDCKVDGFGAMQLKSRVVKKA